MPSPPSATGSDDHLRVRPDVGACPGRTASSDLGRGQASLELVGGDDDAHVSGISPSSAMAVGASSPVSARSSNSVDVVDLGAHRDVGDPLQDDLDHDRHPELGHQLPGLVEGVRQVVGVEHPDRLAAQPFGDLDVVDAVAVDLRGVDVVEGQLDVVVHLEAALALPDQAEVGVVHQHVDVGQLELRADGQLLDHELEVVVARQRDDLGVGPGGDHTQRGRQRPAQRSGLTGVDPAARLVDVQELAAGDLRQPDRRDVDRCPGRTPGSSPRRRAAA